LSGRLECQSDASETEFVAITKFTLVHWHTVDSAAIGRAKINEYKSHAAWVNLGVSTTHVGINQRDLAFRQTSDADHLLAEHKALTGGEHKRASASATLAFTETRLNREGASALVVVNNKFDLDRAKKGVGLVTSMFPGGIAEFTGQRIGDINEGVVIVRRNGDGEGVRGHGSATDIDRAMVVHLAGELAADLDGAYAALEDS
jgi:hypothetical protein